MKWKTGEYGLPDVGSVLSLQKAVTIVATMRRSPATDGDCNVLSLFQNGGNRLLSLRMTKAGVLELDVWTDFRDEPLRLSCPDLYLDAYGVTKVIVYIVYQGYKLELYVDGVLVDEEWPAGRIPFSLAEKLVVGEPGLLAAEAVAYPRLLGQEELSRAASIVDGSGARALKRIVQKRKPGAYWKPFGHNTGVGDCMPFYHDGSFHVFYLIDRRAHRSKWGSGAHQWAHISSTNLIDWTEHPLAIGITEETEGSICTGSVIHYDGLYYAFYAVRAMGDLPARLTCATSADGIHFVKSDQTFQLSHPYHSPSARDPVVLRDEDGLFHMLVTTSDLRIPIQRNGALAHLVSEDLHNWKQLEPLIAPGFPVQPECADWFYWKGWYYLIFSHAATSTRYWKSRSPQGPWERPSPDILDGDQYIVPKTAPFGDDRRIMVGFVPVNGEYGGKMVFRELVQLSNGDLGTRFADELLPRSVASLPLRPRPLTGEMVLREQAIELHSALGYASVDLGEMRKGFRFRATIQPIQDTPAFGLIARASDSLDQGIEIRIEPDNCKAAIKQLPAHHGSRSDLASLTQVSDKNGAYEIDLIVYEDCVDIEINRERTLVARVNSISGSHLALFVHFGAVAFRSIQFEQIQIV